MERKVITMIPITKGEWAVPQGSSQGHINDWDKDPKGAGMYFMELVFDWTLFPKGTQGKLYAEIMGAHVRESADIEMRLAYQLKAAEWIPVEGSNIRHTGSNRWQLLESKWFELPHKPGVSCLWIQGKSHNKGICHVALVTLVIAEVMGEKNTWIDPDLLEKMVKKNPPSGQLTDIPEPTEEEITAKVDEWTGLHVT